MTISPSFFEQTRSDNWPDSGWTAMASVFSFEVMSKKGVATLDIAKTSKKVAALRVELEEKAKHPRSILRLQLSAGAVLAVEGVVTRLCASLQAAATKSGSGIRQSSENAIVTVLGEFESTRFLILDVTAELMNGGQALSSSAAVLKCTEQLLSESLSVLTTLAMEEPLLSEEDTASAVRLLSDVSLFLRSSSLPMGGGLSATKDIAESIGLQDVSSE